MTIRFQRLLIILISLILLALATILILINSKNNLIFFYTPTELMNSSVKINDKIRIGGMVKKNSINISSEKINFVITDFNNEINVMYSGLVPNLFQENKGVVAEGFLEDKNYFKAEKILAKHDENYMPPKIKEKLGEK